MRFTVTPDWKDNQLLRLVLAWFLVFVPSFCEVTLSVLLRGPRTEVLGTLLFYLQGYADPQAAAVLAVIVVGVLLLGMGLRWSISRA